MKYLKRILFILLALPCGVAAQCVQTVDFYTWEATGDSTYAGSNGWQVLSSGTELYSQQNTNFPRMFVGPDTLINVRVTGTFRVENYTDDDYVGFVFGFKQTWDQAWWGTQWMQHEYMLFDWKKNGQNYLGYVASEGFSLNRVNGNFQRTNAGAFPSFWVHTNSTQFNVLQTAFSTTNGWVPYTYYDFELYYTPTRAVILIDSDTIFDQSGCFEPGLFGFYNYSQESARYLNFNYELFIDYQIEHENVCFGDTARFFFTDTGGCAGLTAFSNLDTFYWDLGDGTITNDTNPWHLYSYPDTFTVSLIATDINGCTDTSTKDIYIHPPAIAGIDFENICFADSMQLEDNSFLPMGGFVAEWDWDMGDGAGSSSQENPSYLYTQPGTYTVELIIETNAGCRDTTDTSVTVYPLPDVDFSFQNACEGYAVTFEDLSQATASPIVNNAWDVDNDGVSEYTGLNISHVYNNFGDYPVELKVTDSLGCRDSISKTIVVHPIPEANFFGPGVCFQDASQFIDSSSVDLGNIAQWVWNYGDGNSYTYAGNNPPQPGPIHLYDNPGSKNVRLTVTTDSGCTDSILKTIQVYYLPVANFFADSVCDNQITTFTQASYNQSGSLSYFKWNFGDGDSSFASSPQHAYTTPGIHVVTLTVTSSLGCEDTAQRQVRVFPTPNTAFGWINNVCEGDPLPFSDQSTIPQVTPGGDQIVAWEWIFNGADSQYVQHPVYQTTKYENIHVRLTTWSNHGCSTFSENTALIFPLPKASFTALPACAFDSTRFTNTSKVENGLIEETYWDFGNGDNSEEEHPKAVYTAPGTYTVHLEVHSNKGCVDEVSREITIPATPVAAFSFLPSEGCSPLRIDASNLSTLSQGSMHFEWYVNDSLYSTESDPHFVLRNDTVIPEFYDVKLLAYSDLGCMHKAVEYNAIAVLPAPMAGFSTIADAFHALDPHVEFTNTSRQGIRWLWNFGDGRMSDDFAPDHQFESSGEYEVSQITWNNYSCTDTTMQVIVVDPFTSLYIPSAFTPNGDGVNDQWYVKGFNEGKKFEIAIFDRWGEKMFESEDMEFRWDGHMPNSTDMAPTSAYVYQIRFITSDDEERELYGTFHLVR